MNSLTDNELVLPEFGIISDSEDVALIKVGRKELTPIRFEIAHVSLEVGQQAILTGYGATYDHASSAVTMITGRLDVQDFGSAIYTDLLEARSVTASRSCSGDSGAPIYIGNIIYGVHTAGGFNPTCTDGKNSLMWHTNIASRSDWITATIKDNAGLTEDEIRKAAAGLSTIASPSTRFNWSRCTGKVSLLL
ncbi:trypsin-like serine protease [Corynebacterium suedekumii]|nr:trypsin-like serine protease [Corynebacterium suedekumii]